MKISQMNKCFLEITKGCFLSSCCEYPAIIYNLRAQKARACSQDCLHLHYKHLQKEPTRNPHFKTHLDLPQKLYQSRRGPGAPASESMRLSSPPARLQGDGQFMIEKHLRFCSIVYETGATCGCSWVGLPGCRRRRDVSGTRRMLCLLPG